MNFDTDQPREPGILPVSEQIENLPPWRVRESPDPADEIVINLPLTQFAAQVVAGALYLGLHYIDDGPERKEIYEIADLLYEETEPEAQP